MSDRRDRMAAQEELELLERVFLRIGSAETDEQLQSVLHRFLPPVLLKLASQHDAVRKKVLELLVHINKRLKSRPKVQLPVEALLLQYQDPASISFVTNFTILYIKSGYPRLEKEKQAELASALVQCLDGKPPLQQDVLLQLFTFSLPHVQYPSDAERRKGMFGLNEKREAGEMIIEFVKDYLMIPMLLSEEKTDDGEGDGGTAPPRPSNAKPVFSVPPGMSRNALKRLLCDGQRPDPDVSEENKLGIIRFLGAEIFPPEDVIIPLIIASAEPRYSICKVADHEVKKIHNDVDWNDPRVVTNMYSVFLGSVTFKDRPAPKPDDKRRPATSRIRVKIFPYLFRSKLAADLFPYNVQLVFDCMYGEFTHPKLMAVGMEFVNHMCNNASDENLQPRAPVLLNGMVKLLGGAADADFVELRKHTYTAVGNLVKRIPSLIQKDFLLIQTFFGALSKEQGDSKMHVQEGLGLIGEALKKQGASLDKQAFEAVIKGYLVKNDKSVRYQAIHFTAKLFPGNHKNSRFSLLLATDDQDEEIRKTALRGLTSGGLDEPFDHEEESKEEPKKKVTPKFGDFMKFIVEKMESRRTGTNVYKMGTNGAVFTPAIYKHFVLYIRSCLISDAGLHRKPELEFPSPLDADSPTVSLYLKVLLSNPKSASSVKSYMDLIVEAMKALSSESIVYCLLEVVALVPEQLACKLSDKLGIIKNLLQHSRDEMRDFAAQVYGIVASQSAPSRLVGLMKDLLKGCRDNKDQNIQNQHGSILALGHTISRYYLRKRKERSEVTVEDMEVDNSGNDDQINALISKSADLFVTLLNSSNELVITAACNALTAVARYGSLLIPNGKLTSDDPNKETAEKKMKKDGNGKSTKAGLVERLVALCCTTKMSNKTREQAATTLGMLPVSESVFPHIQAVLEGLLSTSTSREVELHFAVGHALCDAVMGPSSSSARDPWTEDEKQGQPKASKDGKDWVTWVLNKMLQDGIGSPDPHKRMAACMWLLSLVKKCGHHPSVQPLMKNIQSGFVSMLSESDHFTQDLASKGLSIVYDQSSEDERKELVSILVDTLLTGKSVKKEVTDNTKLFQEGQLGHQPGGGNLTTYKELCSLASDLNQPDLIYKFMHLANHNAMWNSRKGAAFGFGSIAVHAKDELAKHLPQLVPKLYRYQYDPSGPVREAMTSIWMALVKDNKNVVDTYLKEILDDLLVHMTGGLWRSRESSCWALADVIVGRSVDHVVEYLPKLWESCFLVMDDIKESVRKAAESASKSLKKVTIKLCDLNYGKVGEKAVSLVLPCLLRRGLTCTVKEVQSISLSTLVSVSKNASKLLRPHIPVLVTALLESLSSLEPQDMNYLSLHLSGNKETMEKLDNVRIAASKASPMMETINLCVQYVDGEILSELVPRVNDLIKSGIGIGTKAGCCHLIMLLLQQCPMDMGPYAGKLLGSLLSGLNDKSAAVRKTNATTIGQLIKVAKDSSVEKLLKRLQSLYMEKDEEALHSSCALTIHAMSTYNHDILKRHLAIAMPLAFLAMHEKTEAEKAKEGKDSVWEDVWLDSTPGTESGIKLYISEIILLCKESLASNSWPRKAQGARTLNSIASKLKSGLKEQHLTNVLTVLLEGLNGRTWDGKEELLRAIKTVCLSCRASLQVEKEEESSDQPSLSSVFTALLKECKKEKIAYKVVALDTVSSIIESYQIDMYNEIKEIVFPIVQKKMSNGKSEEGDDDEDEEVDSDLKIELQNCAFESLGKVWPTEKETQSKHQVELCTVFCQSLSSVTLKVQATILKSLNKFLERLSLEETTDENNIQGMVSEILPVLCNSLRIVKYNAIRQESLQLTETVIKKLTESSRTPLLSEEMRSNLQAALRLDRADVATRERATGLRKQIDGMPK